MKRKEYFIYLPDLCRNSSVFIAVMLSLLLALIAHLLQETTFSLAGFGFSCVYIIWFSLGVISLLCLLRELLAHCSHWLGSLFFLLLCFSVFIVIEITSQWVISRYFFQFWNWQRFMHYAVVAIIISFLLLRFFILWDVYEQRSKVETQARLQALQSRIQPHFLFNSLNTIAELTVIDPQKAEQAIQCLSGLFRASLSDVQQSHTIEEEIQLCEQYVQLEKWRLADRLRIEWDVNVNSENSMYVPRLILQPLIENAIQHGVQHNVGGGDVLVKISETKKFLNIKVHNTHDEHISKEPGHGLALNNIKERLFVLYDDQQRFKIKEDKKSFEVTMNLPRNLLQVS